MAKSSKRERRPPDPSADTRPPRALYAPAAAIVLIALCGFVFSEIVHFDFVNLDDPTYVTDNPYVADGLSQRGVAWAFATSAAGNWHPLTWLSHMTDVQLFGMNAGRHHLISGLLHGANALLLFGLLLRMTGAPGRSTFVAALFAVHPLHVESVAWVSERKDVLSTLFALLAIWSYVSFVRTKRSGGYVAMIGFFFLGLLSKPMVVTLPLLLLLLDIWPLGRLSLAPFDRSILRSVLLEKAPLFALSLLAGLVALFTQRHVGTAASFEALPLSARAAHAVVAYVSYMGQMFWPVDLAAFYPYPAAGPSTWTLAAALVLVAAIFVCVFRWLTQFPYLFVGWAWFVIGLLPVIGLVQVGNQSMADRYTYVPLVGLFIAIAWGAADATSKWKAVRVWLPVAAALIVVACALAARRQVATWASSERLWTHALEVTAGNYYAHGALGAALADQGRLDEATSHLNEALRIRPNLAEVELDLGEVFARQGKLNDAVVHFSNAVQIDPVFAEARHNLGAALSQQGRAAEAIGEFRQALRLNPDLARTHASLAVALAEGGALEEAVLEFRESLRLQPRQTDVRCDLAIALAQQGHPTEAMRELETALANDPGHVRAREMLAELSSGGR